MTPTFSWKRILIILAAVTILAAGGFIEFLFGPICSYINRHEVEIFKKRFPDAIAISGGAGFEGLIAEREILGQPSYFLQAKLKLSYVRGRAQLVIDMVQRVQDNLLAVRDQLIFHEPLLSEILREPVDSRLFGKYPSTYPKESPVPKEPDRLLGSRTS